MTMRQFIATLVLVNLLLLIWNYSFPYVNPLVDRYVPPPSLTELKLDSASALIPPAGTEKESAVSPPSEVIVDDQSPVTKRAEPLSTDEESGAAKPAADTSVAALDKQAVFVCGTIGPMFNAEEQTSVLSILSLETRAELSVRVDKNQRDLSYWVMIPPLESLAQARDYMRVLSKNAMNESFIVTDEKSRNAISLGVFRSKEKAQRLLDRANKLPLDSKVQMLIRGSHNFWVDFKSEVSGEYFKAIGDLLRQKKHLQHTESSCP